MPKNDLKGSSVSLYTQDTHIDGGMKSRDPVSAIRWLGGKMLHLLNQPDASLFAKISVLIALVPIAAFAAVTETIKAFVNPQKNYLKYSRFVKYAVTSSSGWLKVCALPVGLLTVVLALPAACQYGIKKMLVEPLMKTTQERAVLLQRNALLSPQPVEPVVTRIKLKSNQLAEVDDPNPAAALATLQRILKDHPDKIPVFSAKTQRSVNEYLKSLDHFIPSQKITSRSDENIERSFSAPRSAKNIPTRHETLDAFRRHRPD